MTRWDRRQLLTGAGAALIAAGLPETRAADAAAGTAPGDPPFGLGTVTYNVCKDWDLATLFKLLPQAGIYAVEFRTTHAHGVEPSLSASQRAEVKQRAADAGMRQISLGTVCEFQNPDPAAVRKNVDICRQNIELAHDIGAPGVKVRPNGLPKNVEVPKTLEQIGTTLKEVGAMAADHGVEIWMEVHGSGTQLPENSRTIMDHCGHKSVGVCWNSNPTDVKNGSVREAFELLRPFLKSAHINNLWGDYPYRELFALMRQAGFSRYTLCEVAKPVSPEDGVLFYQCYKGLWRELTRG